MKPDSLNISSNLYFQKSLRAKCAVLKNGIPQDANIYQLDKRDLGYLDKLAKDKKWKNIEFDYALRFAILNQNYGKLNIYVIEDDESNDCIGYCLTTKDQRSDIINFIETLPKDTSPYKYIGESLVTFLLKQVKIKGKSALSAYRIISSKQDFYTKCHFVQWPLEQTRASIDQDFADALEKQNQEHTGKSIEYIG